ncbi:hypothetical protein ACTFIR_000663 [Dictyostelium discoideum]
MKAGNEKTNRNALKTEIKINNNKINFFSILIETSSQMSIFNVIIKYFITQLEKFNIGCKIQIITYGDSVETILEFESEKKKMKESLKDIKFSKTNNEAKLGEAMELCFEGILESGWEPSDFNSKILIFSSGKSTDDSINGFLDNLSLDNVEIYGLACNCSLVTNPNVVINNLQSILPDQKIIQLEKNFNQDMKLLINGGSISGGSIDPYLNFPFNIEVYTTSNETKSIYDDLLLDVKIKPDNGQFSIPSGTIIKFLSNKYYSSYTIQLKRDLDIGESYEETIKLEFKKGQLEKYQFENFPSKISFTIQVAGNERVFEGFVYLNISYFLGDLKSNEMCTNICNISVEGDVGSGKSSLLNGFVNLFNPDNQLEDYFMVNRSMDTKITTSINNISLKDLLSSKDNLCPIQKSLNNINVSWSDSWGLDATDVKLKMKADGKIHHGTKFNDCIILPPDQRYSINCFIFVVSIRNFIGFLRIREIDEKIKEVVSLGITPLLCITFTDVFSNRKVKEIVRNSGNYLSVKESDTFIIKNYKENETFKDISKDMQYLRLLTRAFQLSKLKNEIDLINKSKCSSNLSINNNNNNNCLLINSQLTSSSSPSPSSSPSSSKQIDSNSLSSAMSGEVVNVIIDLISEKGDDIVFTYEFECFQNDLILEIKSKLLNEINPKIDINEWNVTKETGTIILGSTKLSTVIKYSKKEVDNIKLILKKKNQ